MRQILLVSHGTMAEGVYQAAFMIAGNLNNVDYLCLEQGLGIEAFREQFALKIDEIKETEEIVVLADLMGGSPYNSAVALLSEKELLTKSKVISGLNLPLLLTVLFEEKSLDRDKIQNVITTARDGIGVFQIEKNPDEEL
ncbi:PTS fructose transporter subunit IIA [Priestia megaterium]|nr:PTS fructose transporter subunit IIA [Priestia megaterium]